MRKLVTILLVLSFFKMHAQENNATVKIMSFNIRYNNPDDGINKWENRKDWLTQSVRFFDVDIVGAQEVTYEQLTDMENLLPTYSYVGVGREGGKKGEFTPIFYKIDRFELLENDTFWLSETPETVASKGWDAALPRILTWAKFRDKVTGTIFYHFNTHFDHRGKVARVNSAKIIVKEIKRIAKDNPLVVTGDFNSSPNSDPHTLLVKNGLKDTFLQLDLENRYGPDYTANGWKAEDRGPENRIDYIFYNNGIKAINYQVLDGQRGKRYISDHFPVIVQLSLLDN